MKSISLHNIFSLARICNTYRRYYLKDLDMNPALHLYISYLKRHPGIRAEALALRFGLDKTTVTHQLNVLERDGYIRREVSPEDARCRLIYLTKTAEDLVPQIEEAFDTFTDIIFKDLTEDEIALLDLLSTKLYDNAMNSIEN